ncbi:unnamed protein product, partial [Laminaria digitata]
MSRNPDFNTFFLVSTPPVFTATTVATIVATTVRCQCDDGYSGYDCSERVCPTGDDPGSWGQNSEVQLITCQATNGTFTLTFRQEETDPVSASAT